MPIDLNSSYFTPEDYENNECLLLLTFSNEISWQLGNFARDWVLQFRGREGEIYNAVIDVSLVTGHTLFRAPATPGTVLDNDSWIETKKNTVKRTGESSLQNFYKTRKISTMYLSDVNEAGEPENVSYGGSIPIRVRGMDYTIGILTISGANHHKDHIIAYNSLEAFPK